MDCNDRVFIAWAGFGLGFRTRGFANSLNAQVLNSYKPTLLGIKLPTLFRYILQAMDTLKQLIIRRPKLVMVQTPPFALTLTVWFYCLLFNARFITDNHSAGFMEPHFQRYHWIDRPLSRRAIINIAHNHKNIDILEEWKARNPLMILSPAMRREELLDESVALPDELTDKVGSEILKVLMVCSFGCDDCYREVIEAARMMPDARFFITGDWKRVDLDLDALPDNVVMTGFLQRPVFMQLMNHCDVVLSLTTRRDALFWAIRECLALEKPFVATDSEVVTYNFGNYGVFTDNSPEDLTKKILEVVERKNEFIPLMYDYIEADKKRWKKDIMHIEEILERDS